MSVTSINYAGNGNFQMTVNGQTQTFNIADLNTMLRMEQVATYDQQIADQMGEIQRTNQKRKALNTLLSKMRSLKESNGDDDSAVAEPKKGDTSYHIYSSMAAHDMQRDMFASAEVNEKNEVVRWKVSDAELQAKYGMTRGEYFAKLADQQHKGGPDPHQAYAQKIAESDLANRQEKFAAETVSLEGFGGPKTVAAWMKEFGITRTDVNPSDKDKAKSAWDTNINAVKSQIDNITSDSEMQMLRFRQMVDKRGTALQEAKSTLTNDKRLKDAIVQG